MKKLCAAIAILLLSCGGAKLKYNYASSDARIHCSLDCPGNDCNCILGSNNTWYISPEVSE